MKWKDFIKNHSNLDPEEDIACILWIRPDVFEKTQEKYPDVVITDEIADEVLCRMDNKSDCQYGMTWDTLEYHLEEVLQERNLI